MTGYKETGQKARETWIQNTMRERGISYELAEILYKEDMRARAARGGGTKTTKPKGFAAMPKALRREIGRKGGSSKHT